MKVIGTTKEGNLVSMTDTELKIIMFGTDYSKELTEQQTGSWNKRMSIDIGIHALFNKYRSFNNLKMSGEYDTIMYKIDKIKEALEKVELSILIEQEELIKQKP